MKRGAQMPESRVPTLSEFVESCRGAFRFLMDEFGFRETAGSLPKEPFCVRFEKDDRSVEIRGEGYGTTAACHLRCGDKGPLALIYLVPEPSRPKRSRKRDLMGQLDHIREYGELARAHAGDFFNGEVVRFERIWDRQHAARRQHDVGAPSDRTPET